MIKNEKKCVFKKMRNCGTVLRRGEQAQAPSDAASGEEEQLCRKKYFSIFGRRS